MTSKNDQCFHPEVQENGGTIPCNKKRHSHSQYARHHPFQDGVIYEMVRVQYSVDRGDMHTLSETQTPKAHQ